MLVFVLKVLLFTLKATHFDLSYLPRHRKLTTREERLLLWEIPCLRKEEGQFTVKRLMLQAGITALQVSNRTVQRFLRREGFQYLQARKKGNLLEGDLLKRKQFAEKIKKDYDQHVWQNSISFFLDGVSFIHKYNPLDQARHPRDVFGENNMKVSLMGVLLKETIVEAGEG